MSFWFSVPVDSLSAAMAFLSAACHLKRTDSAVVVNAVLTHKSAHSFAQFLRVAELGPLAVGPAVPEPGEHPQHQTEADHQAGNLVLNGILGPRTHQEEAGEHAQVRQH